ncbi:MAG: glycosyltransferase [Omnitrophica WOR_2 bacterium RIFCSPHIGHO2_02_FULL_48_11]|nr:MAG: glycosyltransferase [Omnitrophica WOR_2 bacterium RIFCSPHIGHO2_02_FULL_48_11]
MNKNIDISVAVPIFNEEEVVEEFFKQTTQALAPTNLSYEIIFVDDGSRDRSYELLKKMKQQDAEHVRVLKLARNFGHQLAITAGMRVAQGRAVVVMDGDLQDPPAVIPQFIKEWKNGYQVIYGIRVQRKGESFFKKITAVLFYKLLRVLTKVDIPENVGDFYLLDRKVVDVLNEMQERHRFIRGLVAWVGFKRKGIEYQRDPRFAGHTKFGLWKMLVFSFDAITSFSFVPLKAITALGIIISFFSFIGILASIYVRLFTNSTVVGWTSLMVSILFIGGIQLLAIGLIGEYLARIGDDVKRRPLYTVEEFL